MVASKSSSKASSKSSSAKSFLSAGKGAWRDSPLDRLSLRELSPTESMCVANELAVCSSPGDTVPKILSGDVHVVQFTGWLERTVWHMGPLISLLLTYVVKIV